VLDEYDVKRLLLVTDAWSPQTNGVVTTLSTVIEHLPRLGFEVSVVHPGLFKTWPLPSYPEIRIARNPGKLRQLIDEVEPDAVHIATEGPLGLAARRYCVRNEFAFTTSLHTKFPEYLNVRFRLPLATGYKFLRWFHRPARSTLVTTHSHQQELRAWGLPHLRVWSRGVDTQRFVPDPDFRPNQPPRLVYVGRVAVEKNIEAFLDLEIDADKVIIGDGPARAELEARYSDVSWLGYRKGKALVAEYAKADAFVFPSRTDTFGLVMLEAMACGTPVAAYPVTGPIDVVQNDINGWLDEDLKRAIAGALGVNRQSCRHFACQYGWQTISARFANDLVNRDGRPLLANEDTSKLR
jgi:glycosyltransferase involved in cell wall biosynthesis